MPAASRATELRDLAVRWLPAAGVAGGLLALYVGTRVWLIERFPYFIDEAGIAMYAQAAKDPNQRLSSLYTGIRPGLVWLTAAAMKLGLEPLVAIRVVAMLFALLALVAGTLVAARYVDTTGAIAYLVLSIFTPMLVLYSALGLRDTVIAGLLVAGFLLELKLARSPRFAVAFLLGLTFAGDLLVKDSGKVALYLLPLSLLYFPFRSPRRYRLGLSWLGNVAFALALAWTATLPLKLSPYYAGLGATQQRMGLVRSFSDGASHPLRYFDSASGPLRDGLFTYLTYPVLVLAAAGLVLGLGRRPRFTAIVFIWAAVQIASVIWLATLPYPRYAVPATPFVLLLAAVGASELVRIVRARAASTRVVYFGAAAACVVVLVPSFIFDAKLYADPATAPYPSIDRVQYVSGYASGLGVEQALRELRVLALGHSPLIVLSDPGHAPFALYVLAASRGVDVEWVWPPAPDAPNATVLLTDENYVDPALLHGFHRVWQYQRPYHGVPLALYAKD